MLYNRDMRIPVLIVCGPDISTYEAGQRLHQVLSEVHRLTSPAPPQASPIEVDFLGTGATAGQPTFNPTPAFFSAAFGKLMEVMTLQEYHRRFYIKDLSREKAPDDVEILGLIMDHCDQYQNDEIYRKSITHTFIPQRPPETPPESEFYAELPKPPKTPPWNETAAIPVTHGEEFTASDNR